MVQFIPGLIIDRNYAIKSSRLDCGLAISEIATRKRFKRGRRVVRLLERDLSLNSRCHFSIRIPETLFELRMTEIHRRRFALLRCCDTSTRQCQSPMVSPLFYVLKK